MTAALVLWLRNEASPEGAMPSRNLLLVPALLAPTLLRADTTTVTASWYGPRFQGRLTASGCVFDQHSLTAASKTLPLGTVLRVHYAGRSVDVVITDRGPYVGTRGLDLSRGAADRLGLTTQGVARVHTEVVGYTPLHCRTAAHQKA